MIANNDEIAPMLEAALVNNQGVRYLAAGNAHQAILCFARAAALMNHAAIDGFDAIANFMGETMVTMEIPSLRDECSFYIYDQAFFLTLLSLSKRMGVNDVWAPSQSSCSISLWRTIIAPWSVQAQRRGARRP